MKRLMILLFVCLGLSACATNGNVQNTDLAAQSHVTILMANEISMTEINGKRFQGEYTELADGMYMVSVSPGKHKLTLRYHQQTSGVLSANFVAGQWYQVMYENSSGRNMFKIKSIAPLENQLEEHDM